MKSIKRNYFVLIYFKYFIKYMYLIKNLVHIITYRMIKRIPKINL
jgi:hypothetical protein